jgi:hypothetical protein
MPSVAFVGSILGVQSDVCVGGFLALPYALVGNGQDVLPDQAPVGLTPATTTPQVTLSQEEEEEEEAATPPALIVAEERSSPSPHAP